MGAYETEDGSCRKSRSRNAGVILWNFNEPCFLTSSLENESSVWGRNGSRLDTDKVKSYWGRRFPRKVARSQLVWCFFHGNACAVVKVPAAGIYDNLVNFKRERLPPIRLLVMQHARRDKIIRFCITFWETKI